LETTQNHAIYPFSKMEFQKVTTGTEYLLVVLTCSISIGYSNKGMITMLLVLTKETKKMLLSKCIMTPRTTFINQNHRLMILHKLLG